MPKLKGKVALITGAERGVGKAVAVAFAKEGADVAFTYIDAKREVEEASDTVRIIEEEGRRALAVAGDVRDEKFIGRLVEQVMEEFGTVDIVVNNAAFERSYDSFTDIPTDEFDRAFKTNVYGPFFLVRALFPAMREGGAIINTIAPEVFDPSAKVLPYVAAKGALATFTKALSKEAAERGVRVNGVVAMEAENDDPAALAEAYVHLASEEGRSVNGEIRSAGALAGNGG